jgi:hypothetical protein
MNLDNLLEVTSSAQETSPTTNIEFMRVTFRPVQFLANGKAVFIGDKIGTRVYNPGKEPQLGQLFTGSIHEFKTTPYKIGDNAAEKCTCVAMADENPVEVANNILDRHDACVIVNGVPSIDIPAKKAAAKAAAKAALVAAKKAAKLAEQEEEEELETP